MPSIKSKTINYTGRTISAQSIAVIVKKLTYILSGKNRSGSMKTPYYSNDGMQNFVTKIEGYHCDYVNNFLGWNRIDSNYILTEGTSIYSKCMSQHTC